MAPYNTRSSSLQKTKRSTRSSKQNERRPPNISSIVDPDTDDDDVNMVVTPTPSTSTYINNNKQQLKNNDGSSSIIQRLSQELARTAVLDNNNNMDIDDDLIVERQRREMTQIFGSQKSMQDEQVIKSQEWVVKSFSQPSTSENNDKKRPNILPIPELINKKIQKMTLPTPPLPSPSPPLPPPPPSFKTPTVQQTPIKQQKQKKQRNTQTAQSRTPSPSPSSTSTSRSSTSSINCGKTSTSTKRRQKSAGAKKFANGSDKKMYTIQMGLRTLLKITKDTKSTDQNYKIYTQIQSDVDRVAKWKICGSYFLEFCINHHRGWLLNHIFSNGAKKIIPQIFNILKVPRSQGKQPIYDVNLIELYDEYSNIITRLNETDNLNIPLRFNVDCLSKLCDDQIETYLTCFENNINTHKYKRLFKYIKKELNISGPEAYNILSDLIERNIRPENIKLFDQFKDLNFKLFNNNSNWHKFLPFFIELQKLTTNFIVVPINHFGWHHVRYSTSALRFFVGQLSNVKLSEECKTLSDEALWKKIFNIDPESSLGKRFYLSLTTDGASVSIQCQKDVVNKNNNLDNNNIQKDVPKITILSQHSLDDLKNYNITHFSSIDQGQRCVVSGIHFKNISDLKKKSKQKRFAIKNSTWLYRSGFFRNEKKRKRITSTADEKVEKIVQSVEFKNIINLKNPINYLLNLKFRLLCFAIQQPVYGTLKMTLLKWNISIRKRTYLDDLAYFIATGQRKKKYLKKKIIDEKKKTKNIKAKELKKLRKQNYLKNHPSDKDKKTKHQLKLARKLESQVKLAAKNKSTMTDKQKKQRARNRKREKRLKEGTKSLEKQHKLELKLSFEKQQLNYHQEKEKKRKEYNNNKNKKIHNNSNNNNTKVREYSCCFIGDPNPQLRPKGYQRPPLCKLEKKMLEFKFVILVRVDEYKTTQNCSKCHRQLIVSTHGHRSAYCRSCGITWHRDINAGISVGNIGTTYAGMNPDDDIANYSNFERSRKK